MKKHLLRALCLTFVLALCMPMVACDMEFGGLVGELMQDMNADGGNHDIMDITPEIDKNWADVMTSAPETEIATEDFTYDVPVTEEPTIMPSEQTTEHPTTAPETVYDGIESVEPQIPAIVSYSFDECDAWIGEERVIQFFTPGQSNGWDGQPVIEDANVEYIRIWGWIAFGSETLGELGYQIDDEPAVFDKSFAAEPEEGLVQFKEDIGAGSITRMDVRIPIKELSGNHTLRVIARTEDGYEEVLVKIVMEKAADPYAPVFHYDAAHIADMVNKDYGYDMQCDALSADGSYATLSTVEGIDPYCYLQVCNGNKFTGVRYIVIAYRTNAQGSVGQVYVGSSTGPVGGVDEHKFDYVADGAWHTYVIDTAKIDAINGAHDVSYLRYDIYHLPESAGQSIDIAYVAGFDSMEDVMLFQTQNQLG